MANNQPLSTAHNNTRLTTSHCTTDFLSQLMPNLSCEQNWLDMFPITKQRIEHFLQLPMPLLLLNTQFWLAAKEVVECCIKDQQPMLALQDYDQEKLFGRFNFIDKNQVTIQQGEIYNLQNGLLILHISPLLANPKLWFSVKSFLLNQKISSNTPVNADKLRITSPIDSGININTKIILVANRYQLDELSQIDPDFTQINSLFAELSADVEASTENIRALQQYINFCVDNKSLSPLTDGAFDQLFNYLSRLCEHQNKLLFSPQVIESILDYAQLLSRHCGNETNNISATHIQQALEIQTKAQSHAQDFSDQALLEKQLKIQLQGEMIGQINGLSVVELMGYPTEFGEIFRISASDMVGDGEIIDVERKVELAGNVHAKSTLIVQGYLNHLFTHINNFPLSCNVVFEQSYQESDGDSASLAILLAVTSCYSQLPIKQNLFVTGALDQHGNVLVIGGINQKIESITRLFNLGLLTEPVTVLMPIANQINLVLSETTLALIKDNKINIHAIQHSLEAFPFAMSDNFESVLEKINKRILFLHKEEDDEPPSFVTKFLNLLR